MYVTNMLFLDASLHLFVSLELFFVRRSLRLLLGVEHGPVSPRGAEPFVGATPTARSGRGPAAREDLKTF